MIIFLWFWDTFQAEEFSLYAAFLQAFLYHRAFALGTGVSKLGDNPIKVFGAESSDAVIVFHVASGLAEI